jgi:hypothetical protein
MRNFHILNLGAGVQSTAVALLNHEGEYRVPSDSGTFDAAIFADTGEEQEQTYQHLEWLKEEVKETFPVLIRSVGSRLGDDLQAGKNSTQRFAAIPAYTTSVEGQPSGITRRQCTKEYKIEVVEKAIRREIIGLEYRKHMPKDVLVTQYFGFSTDEPGRAARSRLRFKQLRWGEVEFPLFHDHLLMTRLDCQNYLESRVPHEVVSSACVFCPFKSNREWRRLRDTDPKGWERAVYIDRRIREEGVVANRNLEENLYVHRTCRPLDKADLGESQKGLFADLECEGGCGL